MAPSTKLLYIYVKYNQYLLSIRRRTRQVAFIWARFKASRSLFYPGSMGQGLQDRNGFVSKDIRKPFTSNGTSDLSI